MHPRRSLATLPVLAAVIALGGCTVPAATSVGPRPSHTPASSSASSRASTTAPPTSSQPPVPTTTTPAAPPQPAPPPPVPWRVGAHPLPLRPDGYGQVLPTPAVLVDRRLPTADLLPPPGTAAFNATVTNVPAGVVARSTWRPGCPVRLDQLRYLTLSFWGFDGRRHTGELIVHARVATGIVEVFRQLHDARFPIEEMRVTTAAELTAAPTGDGNNTQSFVCRHAEGQTRWSAHAYGLALDLNPFNNPYSTRNLVLPELASAYVDRRHVRPGMVQSGDLVVRAFGRIGWRWGGTWSTPRDLMHFTATGG